ncbi:MAG TPA: hypothetical protein VFQ74_00045 [Pseudolysinimonas sp.]|nr:hypothetical protein [Pseudolysinimonas sp.]
MTVPVGETLVLEFDAQAGTTFTAKVLFSHASFHADAELAKQCTAASTALSDLADASNGLAESAISQQQAEGLMAQASVALQPASSAGVVGRQLEALRAWLINNPQADPRTAPGLGTGTITDLCVDNESPLIIVSSYGG